MNILGISAYYHDSAAALVVDGQLVAAAQEERFSRKKHDARFPAKAIRYCLNEIGTELNGIDLLVFYDKPLINFEAFCISLNSADPKVGASSLIEIQKALSS